MPLHPDFRDLLAVFAAHEVDLPNSTESRHEPSLGEVDTTLVDALLALSPEERLRHNDRMLRTIELLRQGIAEKPGDNAR
jgi:hypothetical protein